MIAKHCRLAATLVFMSLAALAFAQSTDNPSSTPLGRGSGTDGSRPADGAIKGGAIVPGETGGVPTDRAASRCSDLTGTLREQCLARERDAGAGATRPPEVDVVKPPTAREAPPPQNPAPTLN
jgi:hypothetical protein